MPRGKASPSKPDLPKAPPKPRYVKDETINAARDADYTAKSKAYMAAMAAHSKAMDKRDASKKRDARAFWAQEQPNTKVAMRPQSKPPTTASSSLASPRRSPRHSTALAPSSSSDDRMLDSSSAPGPTALVASTFSDGRISVRLRPPPKPSPPPSPPPRASVPSSSSITCRQGHAMARRTTIPAIPAYYCGVSCNQCGRIDLVNSCPFFYHCQLCRYDTCDVCLPRPPPPCDVLAYRTAARLATAAPARPAALVASISSSSSRALTEAALSMERRLLERQRDHPRSFDFGNHNRLLCVSDAYRRGESDCLCNPDGLPKPASDCRCGRITAARLAAQVRRPSAPPASHPAPPDSALILTLNLITGQVV